MAAPSLDALSARYAAEGVGSAFIYTHEAHPGENYPHLTTMDQKFTHARALRDTLGVRRPILVDALDGACHRAYGSMPNMSWIFARSGMVVYKADWTADSSLENALTYLLEVQRRRREGEPLVPFTVQRLDYRQRDTEAFRRGLERNGPRAVREFDEAFG